MSRVRYSVDLHALPDICQDIELVVATDLKPSAAALMRTLGVTVTIDKARAEKLHPRNPTLGRPKREARRARTTCLRCGTHVDLTTPGCSTCKRRHKARRYAGRPTPRVEPGQPHAATASDPPRHQETQ